MYSCSPAWPNAKTAAAPSNKCIIEGTRRAGSRRGGSHARQPADPQRQRRDETETATTDTTATTVATTTKTTGLPVPPMHQFSLHLACHQIPGVSQGRSQNPLKVNKFPGHPKTTKIDPRYPKPFKTRSQRPHLDTTIMRKSAKPNLMKT